MLKSCFSIFFGVVVCHLSGMLFRLIIAKKQPSNIIYRMYLAEAGKLLVFILGVVVIFKFLPINHNIFIVSVSGYLIINFTKNLLKLII